MPQLGDSPRGGGFRYASSSVATASTTTTTTPATGVVAPPTAVSISNYCGPNLNASTLPRFHPPKPEASSSSSTHHYPFARPTDVDTMKARIISHPHYSNLLKAYMDCQKVFQISPLLLLISIEVKYTYICVSVC